MHKLLRTSHGYFSSPLKGQTNYSAEALSHLRNHSKRPDLALDNSGGGLRPSRKPATDDLFATSESDSMEDSQLRISHPWPEWVGLMECLINRNYFECDETVLRGRDLGRKEANFIRSACLNFARDRFDLIRFLSKKHVKIVAACGCPSLDRKVVNSGKRLRFHVDIDEEETCGSCNLRGDCDRAYLKPREDEDGRTVDVMRILLTYGLDPISGTVENKPCLNKEVEESVRILLKELVEYSQRRLDPNLLKSRTLKNVEAVSDNSSVQEEGSINVSMKHGDWLCPKCNFLNFGKNLKCLRCDCFCEEKLKKLKEDRNHLPLKKGDWLCDTCNFLNFARNTKCLQCKESPSIRKINPGEWECPSCNYINFRKNMGCLKCDHRRPKTAGAENHLNNYRHLEDIRSSVHEGDSIDVNTQTYEQRQNQSFDVNDRRYMEDESCRDSRNEASDFLDFPITGGKGELSSNVEKRETWKLQMLEKSKCDVKVIKDEEFRSPSVPSRFELLNPGDDEEMSEWFGPQKSA